MIVTLFWCAYTARGTPEYLPITRSWFAAELSMSGQYGGCKQRGQPAMVSLKTLFMPRLAICSRDLHWHWINRTLLCDTMEVSMLSRAWLTVAQHVFQPALTGRPELISRKIVSGEPGTKAIAVSRFREQLSPANWVQGVIAISRKISRSWAPKKWGPTCDRDISNSAIYTTAIYRAYTVAIRLPNMPVLSLACHLPHNTPHIPSCYNNEQTIKQTKAINNSYIYINISCKCDTNHAGYFTLDAYASRPVACH